MIHLHKRGHLKDNYREWLLILLIPRLWMKITEFLRGDSVRMYGHSAFGGHFLPLRGDFWYPQSFGQP